MTHCLQAMLTAELTDNAATQKFEDQGKGEKDEYNNGTD